MFFNKNWDVTEYALLTAEEREIEYRRSLYNTMCCVCGDVTEFDDEKDEEFSIPLIMFTDSQQIPLPELGQELQRLKRLQPLYQQHRRERRLFKLPKIRSFAWKGRQ